MTEVRWTSSTYQSTDAQDSVEATERYRRIDGMWQYVGITYAWYTSGSIDALSSSDDPSGLGMDPVLLDDIMGGDPSYAAGGYCIDDGNIRRGEYGAETATEIDIHCANYDYAIGRWIYDADPQASAGCVDELTTNEQYLEYAARPDKTIRTGAIIQ